jgi:hypothetical protein
MRLLGRAGHAADLAIPDAEGEWVAPIAAAINDLHKVTGAVPNHLSLTYRELTAIGETKQFTDLVKYTGESARSDARDVLAKVFGVTVQVETDWITNEDGMQIPLAHTADEVVTFQLLYGAVAFGPELLRANRGIANWIREDK